MLHSLAEFLNYQATIGATYLYSLERSSLECRAVRVGAMDHVSAVRASELAGCVETEIVILHVAPAVSTKRLFPHRTALRRYLTTHTRSLRNAPSTRRLV